MDNWAIVDDGVMEGVGGEGSIELTPRSRRTNPLPQPPYRENAPHPPCGHPLPLGGGEGRGEGGERSVFIVDGEQDIPEESPELNFILKRCLQRIHRWPLPFHWAYADWREEAASEGQSAAWMALRDYDASRGVPFSAFLYLRVMASVLTRYRQEWKFGRRCVSTPEAWEVEDPAAEAFGHNADHESLRHALALLPDADRQLLVELFWEDRTERDIARSHHMTQPALNKRKRLILHHLYEHLDGAKIITISGYQNATRCNNYI